MVGESYYLVVACNNVDFHQQKNLWAGHKIPLGKTDAFSPRPVIEGRLTIQCDECEKTYSYEPEEIIRWIGQPAPFTPHPQFLNI